MNFPYFQRDTELQIRNIFILKNKQNNEHFHFSSHICLIDKRNHEKAVLQNMSNKKTKTNKKQELEYSITSTILICTSVIVYYNYYHYRQKAKKLKTAAEETMACAKYSPQVHKLRMLFSE